MRGVSAGESMEIKRIDFNDEMGSLLLSESLPIDDLACPSKSNYFVAFEHGNWLAQSVLKYRTKPGCFASWLSMPTFMGKALQVAL